MNVRHPRISRPALRALAWSFVLLTLGLTASCARDGRIEESKFVSLGGIEQFVTIRGDRATNPVLLILHGGPGAVQSPYAAVYELYEHEYTVVQWDQRGAGRTYGRYGEATPDLTLDRLAADGIELAEYLKKRFDNAKIILLGHSWGSVVGVEMAKRRPDLFAAYVGTGQASSWDRAARFQYDFVRAEARDKGNQAVLKTLKEPAAFDPRNTADYLSVNEPLTSRLLAKTDLEWYGSLPQRKSAATSAQEAKDIDAGQIFSGRKLQSAIFAEDLFSTASTFDIPFIVIQGSGDVIAPTPLVIDYFSRVQAPRKELRLIEGAGHFALVTHPSEFLAALGATIRR